MMSGLERDQLLENNKLRPELVARASRRSRRQFITMQAENAVPEHAGKQNGQFSDDDSRNATVVPITGALVRLS